MTQGLADLVGNNPSEHAIMEEARKSGFITLYEDGLLKVLEGTVGIEQLEAVAQGVF